MAGIGAGNPMSEVEYTPQALARKAGFDCVRESSGVVQDSSHFELLWDFRYTSIFDKAPIGICVTDEQGLFEYVNPAYCRLYGYQDNELLGRHFTIVVPPEDRELLIKKYETVITGGSEIRGEWNVTAKNGRRLVIFVDASCARDKDGNYKKITFVADITERKQLEEAVQRDMVTASAVQRGFIPPDMEDGRLAVRGLYQPLGLVSGDMYHFMWRDTDVFAGFLIDVMGHGVATALQTSAIRVLIHQFMQREGTLADKMTWINDQSISYFAADSFAAALAFEFDLRQQTLTVVPGGITRFLACSQEWNGVVKLPGFFMGIVPGAEYDQHTVPIRPGDRFVFMSDGIYELLGDSPMCCVLPFERQVDFLCGLLSQSQRRDDASAICILVK